MILLAACEPVSTQDTIIAAVVLGIPTLAYLAALVIPIARARGERRYVVPLCLASAAVGAGLILAGGFDGDRLIADVIWALAIGALLGGVGFAFRRTRMLTYLLTPLLSGGAFALGFIVLFFGAFAFTDACLA